MNILTKFSAIITMALVFQTCYAIQPSPTPEELKAFYKEAYANTIENMSATKEDYATYFSKEFVMTMDGHTYHFDDYVQFMLDIKKEDQSVNIEFKDMIAENNRIATIHVTHIVKKNGDKLDLDVISFFKVQNHQFIEGHELTRIKN